MYPSSRQTSKTYAHHEFSDASEVPYVHVSNLGEGQTATVDKVTERDTNAVYARKTWRISFRNQRQSVKTVVKQQFEDEIFITRQMGGWRDHFVHVLCSYSTPEGYSMILSPAADEGNLVTYLEHYLSIPDATVRATMERVLYNAFGCLASGLAHMHANRIRHRDIKPQNILIHRGTVLYADFGVARNYSGDAQTATEDYPGPFTRKYCAPEVSGYAAGDKRTWKSDVFSLGCVFLYMYAALMPDRELESIVQNRFYEQVERIQSVLQLFEHAREVVECMKGMLQYDQHNRPSADEVVLRLKMRQEKYLCVRCRDHAGNSYPESTKTLSMNSSTLSEQSFMVLNSRTRRGTPAYDRSSECLTDLVMQVSRLRSRRYIDAKTHSQSLLTTPKSDTSTPRSMAGTIVKKYIVPATTTALSYYGIHRRKVLHSTQDDAAMSTKSDKNVALNKSFQYIYEDDIYEWTGLPVVGMGIRLVKRKPYGSLFHSLRVFPVVPSIHEQSMQILTGTVPEIQRLIASGELHPYVQDPEGCNLLHAATRLCRPDIMLLLLAHGVSAPTDESYMTLTHLVTENEQYLPAADAIEYFRALFQIPQYEIDFSPATDNMIFMLLWRRDVVAWLFHNGPSYSSVDEESLHEFCLRATLRRLPLTLFRDGLETARSELLQYVAPVDIQSRLRSNNISVIDDLFFGTVSLWDNIEGYDGYDPDEDEIESDYAWTIGALWLSVLAHFGIDIPSWIVHELSLHPNHLLNDMPCHSSLEVVIPWTTYYGLRRRFLVGRVSPGDDRADDEGENGEVEHTGVSLSETCGYMLGWDVADAVEADLLVDEFWPLVLMCDDGEWPVFDESKDNELAREVRERKKEREIRKKVHLRTPGAWLE